MVEPQFNWFVINTIIPGTFSIKVNGNSDDQWSVRVVKRGVDGKEATADDEDGICTSFLKLVSRSDNARRPVKALVICFSSLYHFTFWPGQEVKIPSSYEYGTRIAYGSGDYVKGFEFKMRGLFLSQGMNLTSFQTGSSQVAWDLNFKSDASVTVNMKVFARNNDRRDGDKKDAEKREGDKDETSRKVYVMYFHNEKRTMVSSMPVIPGTPADITPSEMSPSWPHVHLLYFEKTRRPYYRRGWYGKNRSRTYSANSAPQHNSHRSDGGESSATASTGESTKNGSAQSLTRLVG